MTETEKFEVVNILEEITKYIESKVYISFNIQTWKFSEIDYQVEITVSLETEKLKGIKLVKREKDIMCMAWPKLLLANRMFDLAEKLDNVYLTLERKAYINGLT